MCPTSCYDRSVTRGTSCVLGAALVFVVAVMTSVRAAPAAPAALAQSRDAERGERLMNASCQDCHAVRVIQVQAKSAEEWAKTVDAEIARGAKVAKEDIPVLVEYLTDHHGPLPNGAGKAIVLNVCTMCHDLTRIRRGHRSAEEWEETLNSMLNEGAPLPDDQFPIVHAYLSRHFGVE
jgi:cytochrome c5